MLSRGWAPAAEEGLNGITLSRALAGSLLAALVLGAVVPVGIARAESVDYERDIKPMLKARCYACHGALKQEAGLRLDTGSSIRQGGDSGTAVEVGQPAESLLLEKVIADELSERMPPEGEPLTAAQIERLRVWIVDGAKSPESEQAEIDPREHWAFQLPRRAAVPSLEVRTSGTNPIDGFINAELVRHGLTPRPAAAKLVLLRRVYLDLIGLPPTREELQAFLLDDSPNAYEKVIDRLLNDDRYGERWGPSTFSENGGVAVVSRTAGNEELHTAAEKLRLARRKSAAPLLRRQAAEARVVAARADLASLEARIAAERANYIDAASAEESANLIRIAGRAERQAKLSRAESDLLTHEVALLDTETKPADDASRSKEIEAANQGLATARAAVETARAALGDEQLAESYEPLSPQFPRESTGRRRALALWITSQANPLTARVAVNHVWMRHFRSPLVASVFDFGRNGAQPTHPELLDWLAVEFMESGWDMKHLHRLIVTSAAYRRVSSIGDAHESVAADPENKLLWRMNPWRMESEVLRDSLLAVAGRLDMRQGGVELENKDALTTNRRTLYYSSYPESGGKSAIGELFDAPDPLDCYRRSSSVVPQQALALTNSDLVHQSSMAIVAAWQGATSSAATDTEVDATVRFIEDLFARILCRSPSEKERGICREILDQQQQLAADPQSAAAIIQAREGLTRILLNHNDFVTVR